MPKGELFAGSGQGLYKLRAFGERSKLFKGWLGWIIDDTCKVGVGVGAELDRWYWK